MPESQAPAAPAPAAPQESAPAAPAATPAPSNWREALPPEYRENPALKTIADIPTLTKGYLEAQSRLGNSVRIPSKEAGAEDRKAFRERLLAVGPEYGVMPIPGEGDDPGAFHAALGRPEKPEGYELPEYDDAEYEVDLSEAEAMRPVAHQLGLSNAQFKGLVKAATDANMAKQMEQIRAQQADQAALKKEWGAAHHQRMGQLEKFLTVNNAPKNLMAAVKNGGLDSHSAKWLYNIMETIGGEASEITAQGKGGGSNVLTPSEALSRVGEIEKRMNEIPQGAEEYKQLMARRIDLLRIANP